MLANVLKIEFGTLASYGIVGDMFLTCSTIESRNFRFGVCLASMDAQTAFAKINSTVDGYYTSFIVQQLCDNYEINLPLVHMTHKIIKSPRETRQLFDEFIKKI